MVRAWASPPNVTIPLFEWVDLHGNGSGTTGSRHYDPLNFVANVSDVGQIVFAFQSQPYKGYDPADCPYTGDSS